MSLSLNDSDHDNDHDQFMVEHFLGPDEEQIGKKMKKSSRTTLRKAPNAPKRFKSSYICFFMAKQSSIKEELGTDSTVTNISKRSAEMWKTLTQEERAVWDEIASQDKKRYLMEKSQYTGPWQVPWKRVKKDPSAPKRPMSAFLYFSQGKRSEIKNEKPEIKNTEVSRLLGEMWRNLTVEERAPYVERERIDREKYKVAIAEWREHNEAMKSLNGQNDHESNDIQTDALGNQYAIHNQNQQMLHAGPYQFPINGKHPVILGPKGVPYQPSQIMSSTASQQQHLPSMHATPQPTATYTMPQQIAQLAPATTAIFDDNSGLMQYHHHGGYDYSIDHLGGDTN